MSTRVRVTLITAVFLSLLTLVLVTLWLTIQGRYLHDEQLRDAEGLSLLVSEISGNLLTQGDIVGLATSTDRMIQNEGISRVEVADAVGIVIVDSDHRAYGEKPAIIRRAMRDNEAIIDEGEDHWTVARAVLDDLGNVLGGVVIYLPTEPIISTQKSARNTGALIALLGVAAGVLLAYLAARLITQQFEVMLAGIRRLQSGETAQPMPISGGPEFAEIEHAFNEMADAVGERVRRLEALNAMATSLSTATKLQEMAKILSGCAQSIMGAGSHLWIVDPLYRMLTSIPPPGESALCEPVPSDCRCAIGTAFRRRQVIISDEASREFPATSPLICDFTVRSALIVPLVSQGSTAGVLVLAEPGNRSRISREDESLARAMANLAAPIIMAQLRTDTQARAAAALQALLLPEEMPDIGMDLAAVYVPAERIAGLGGDYYDIVALDTTKWAIIVGDSSGKGLDAARYTATAKYVLRSYVLEYGDPSEVLGWSNRALSAQEQTGRFITVFCGVLDTEARTLTYSIAGHPPPVIYRPSIGKAGLLESYGQALGIMPTGQYIQSVQALESGDVICIYTDGITEARHGDEWFDDTNLMRVIEENAQHTSNEICHAVMDAVRAFTGSGFSDDVVLVVLKVP